MVRTADMKTDQLKAADSTLEKLLTEREHVKAALEVLERLVDRHPAWRKQKPERLPTLKQA